MKTANLKKYFAEGILIVFSVLFALFINRVAENHKTEQRKNVAIESILQELHRNKEVIANWKTIHTEFGNRVKEVALGRNDSLKALMTEQKFVSFDVLYDQEAMF